MHVAVHLEVNIDSPVFHDDDCYAAPDECGASCVTARVELGRLLACVAGSVHAGEREGVLIGGVGAWQVTIRPTLPEWPTP